MTLPATGLVVDRQPDILQRMIGAQRALIDVNINADPSTLLGQLSTIFSTEIARVAALAQDIYDSRSIDVASDIALDDLVSVLGIKRQSAQPTSGEQYFVCTTLNQVIPATSQVSSASTGSKYVVQDSVVMTPTACRGVNIDVLTLAASYLYSVTINGDIYTWSDVGVPANNLVVLNALNAAIVAAVATHPEYTSSIVNSKLNIVSNDYLDLSITVDSRLKYYDITCAGNVRSTVNAAISQAPSTVVTIRTPVSGWTSTYNPQYFAEGREIETDAELRLRALLQNTSGKATSDAIRAALLATTGVTSASIIERYYSQGVDPVTYQPEGSISCVVVGGTDDLVAQSIWDNKAAGIETFGNTTNSNVVDSSGGNRTVKFSRVANVPISVKVEFVRFNDEDFPTPLATGYAAIQEAVVEYGNSIGIGIDIIPTRFYGAVYSAVSGLSDVVVYISDDAGATWVLTNITITDSETSYFEIAQVVIDDVTP